MRNWLPEGRSMKNKTALSLITVLIMIAGPVFAQTWSNPDAPPPPKNEAAPRSNAPSSGPGADTLTPFLEELTSLLDRGERERLLDPWYLRDLRDLVAKYANPWSRLLFRDDFSSRAPEPEKPWRVTTGEFLIDWRYGMRSVIEPVAEAANQAVPQEAPNQTIRTNDPKDLARILLGTILSGSANRSDNRSGNQSGNQTGNQAQNTQSQQSSQQTQPNAPSFAAIQAETAITNAFAIDLEITARDLRNAVSNGFEFGPYQGANAAAGYRLSYATPNPQASAAAERDGGIKLLRISQRRGVGVIEYGSKPVNFEDGTPHRLLWTRDAQGRTIIAVDGITLIDTVDRSFRDPFDGFAFINRGGDYAVRQIAIAGTE